MADENQSDTTGTENSPTPTPAPDAGEPKPDAGKEAQNAPKPTDDDASADDDGSLLGGAKADPGSGDDGEDDDKNDADGEDDKAAAGPPETYELKVEVPGEDGKPVEVEIDQALLTEATPVLKDLGLTNDQANKVAALVPKVQQRFAQQQADSFAAMKADWAKEVQADPEIGGKNWPQTEALAAKALDTFGAPSVKDADGNETNEFRILLNETGLGNHPVMLKMFRQIGEKLGEDGFARSEAPPPKPKSRAEILYPDDLPKQGAK